MIRDEAGFGLMEAMITTMILGLVITVVVGGMASSLLFAGVHRETVSVNEVLAAAVERVNSDSTAYQGCATTTNETYLNAARSALPAGWAASKLTITEIKYWNGNGDANNDGVSEGVWFDNQDATEDPTQNPPAEAGTCQYENEDVPDPNQPGVINKSHRLHPQLIEIALVSADGRAHDKTSFVKTRPQAS